MPESHQGASPNSISPKNDSASEAYKLEPCPFCGGGATLNASGLFDLRYQVQCDICYSGTGMSTNPNKVISHWNTRPKREAEPVAADMQKVREARLALERGIEKGNWRMVKNALALLTQPNKEKADE